MAITMSGVTYSGNVSVGREIDPYFRNNVLLLNNSGVNAANNNTFLDSSINNFTVTRNGNVTQGSVSPYHPTGYWSNYFDGTGDYLDVVGTNGSANFSFGTGDVTIECWVYHNTISGTQNYYRTQGSGANAAYLFRSTGGTIEWSVYNAVGSVLMSAFSATSALVTNTWYHVAAVRSGNIHTIYINGQASGTAVTASYSAPTIQQDIGIGREKFNLENMNGYISNHRVVKGTAVYTGNFTPSTLPLTAISGTVLLTCQDNRFKDNSINNYSLTVVGNTATSHFNPLSPINTYLPAQYGSSMYFDGTGDSLTTTGANLAAGAGNFTWECWVYVAGATAYQTFIDSRNGTTDAGLYFGLNTGTLTPIILNQNTLIFTSSISLVAGTWNHVALVRNSGTIVVYVNGVSGGSLVNSYTLSSTTYGIGSYYSSSSNILSGYLSNLRIVNGTAVYTSAFTPPTAPVSAINGTSLLINAADAGIYDATGINNVETVGNAQVSTTQAKWGASSMYLDGTGDYLTPPPNSAFSFGTGDFTIECWAYITGSVNNNGVFHLANIYFPAATSGIAVAAQDVAGGWIVYYGSSSNITSTTPPLANTWTHLALVRASGVIKLYVNGTSVISTSDTTNYTYTYLAIGGYYNTSYLMTGYIEDFRITKGIARYTANFLPPTSSTPTTGCNF